MRKPENFPFSGHIQKFQLTSGNIAYGPRPETDKEVEQRTQSRGTAQYGYLGGHTVMESASN